MRDFIKTLHVWFAAAAEPESGVTAIEYGLIAALIAVVIIVGVTAIRHKRIERDVFRQQVFALSKPGLRGAADAVAHSAQALRHFFPAPAAMPRAVHE